MSTLLFVFTKISQQQLIINDLQYVNRMLNILLSVCTESRMPFKALLLYGLSQFNSNKFKNSTNQY